MQKSASAIFIHRILLLPLVGTALVAGLTSFGAQPAQAENGGHSIVHNGPDRAGSVWYKHDGDHFFLCDELKDNRSVLVQYDSKGDGKGMKDRWNWWGPSKFGGCKDINLNVREDLPLEYRVCLGVNGHLGGKKGRPTVCGHKETVVNP